MELIPFMFAVIPALGILAYFYRQDSQKPEPKGLIVKTFLFGILSTIPAVVLERLVGMFSPLIAHLPWIIALFRSFVIAAMVEEWIKWRVIKLAVYENDHFDEVTDGIIYTISASLGFACLENILYVMGGGLVTAVVRAVTAIPLHATASGIMGFYFGLARMSKTKEKEDTNIRKGLLWGIFIHGLYDFLLFANPLSTFPLWIGAFLIIPLGLYFLQKLIIRAKRLDLDQFL